MLALLQPVLAALVGAAMSVFGILHSVQLLPTPAIWHQVVSASPSFLTVLLFVACLGLALGGLAMLVAGVRDTQFRIRQIRGVPWDHVPAAPGSRGLARPRNDPRNDPRYDPRKDPRFDPRFDRYDEAEDSWR